MDNLLHAAHKTVTGVESLRALAGAGACGRCGQTGRVLLTTRTPAQLDIGSWPRAVAWSTSRLLPPAQLPLHPNCPHTCCAGANTRDAPQRLLDFDPTACEVGGLFDDRKRLAKSASQQQVAAPAK